MVKATGIVRRVDELGRFVIPIELRRTLGIDVRDSLEVFTEEGRIVLRKYQPLCIFCSGSALVASIQGKNVCRACRELLGSGSASVAL